MEDFDQVITSYEATISTLMVQKARKDDIEMKKREELEEEMSEGFSKKLKITELIKSYMEWELDATLTDLQIIRQQQEFIKKIAAIVSEYSSNEEKIEESNQMLKEADAAIEHLKKEKNDKFHECARYKALLKDALRLVPKMQRKKFVDEKIKGIASVENEEDDGVDAENESKGATNTGNKETKEFDNIQSEMPDKVCLECGDDISEKGVSAKYCDECAKKVKYKQSYASRVKGKEKIKKGAESPEGQSHVT